MRGIVKRYLLQVLARAARPPGAAVAGLTYHAIDESGSPISFPAALLEAHLAWLAEHGYRALTASEAGAALAGGPEPPGPRVVITFDDAFRSVYEQALPRLEKHGFVGTVFCPSEHVGGRGLWARRATVPDLPLMGWEELRTLRERGWEIGGHTRSHASLPDLPPAEAREEIAGGKQRLEEGLQASVASFAYPYGALDAVSARLVAEAGFASAWSMQPVLNRPRSDPYRLGRFNSDRIRSGSPREARTALQVYLGGRYGAYALLTARRVRVRAPRREPPPRSGQ